MSIFDILSAKDAGSLTATQDEAHRAKYQHFRALLNHNHDALLPMAEMEELYFSGRIFNMGTVIRKYAQLFDHVLNLATELNELSAGRKSIQEITVLISPQATFTEQKKL
ncbi:MAG: hypothetical protein KJ702_13035, partial [Gammaproteobacteria bacterium]|nr:hypothetical protein [Gammaproteobacteria bacterium]